MESRGKHQKDIEKRFLLLKSMEAEEARVIVQSHAHRDYATAIKALKQSYGSPQVIILCLCRRQWLVITTLMIEKDYSAYWTGMF